MQLIPPTAARVAKTARLARAYPRNPLEPESNVALGTNISKICCSRYSNNWHKALGCIQRRRSGNGPMGERNRHRGYRRDRRANPHVETRGYVKLVIRNHRIYKRLYERKNERGALATSNRSHRRCFRSSPGKASTIIRESTCFYRNVMLSAVEEVGAIALILPADHSKRGPAPSVAVWWTVW